MEYKVGDKVRLKVDVMRFIKGEIVSVYAIGTYFIYCENDAGLQDALDINEVEAVARQQYTERKLKDGEYGILSVEQGDIFFSDDPTPAQLREAAATLIAMSYELEGKA